jgi:hypothetical protein
MNEWLVIKEKGQYFILLKLYLDKQLLLLLFKLVINRQKISLLFK